MADESSKTQRRKEARKAAHKLRSDVSWMSPVGNDPMEKLRQLDQQARDERVYDESGECAACRTARADSGDDTALCQTHLADAMGF